METSALTADPQRALDMLSKHTLADGYPLVVDLSRSHGSYIYDAKRDTEYLDLFTCFATCPLGYNHPHLLRAESTDKLGRTAVNKPSNSDIYSWEYVEFVETFTRVAKPDYMKYAFFIEGGTLAVENALKAAFDWKVHKNLAKGVGEEKGYKVIHFKDAFHGRSGYTLSMTNTDPAKTQFFPKFDWPRIDNPACRYPMEGDNLSRVQAAEATSLDQIRDAIAADPDDVACIIIEPIQSEGGDHHFRIDFHRQLRRICDESDILLIHDEVQTGFGATGRFWAHEHYVRPDLLAFGKKSQVCGILAGPRLDEVPENVFRVSSRINSTWGGNLVDMVRCSLYLGIYERENLLDHVEKSGRYLLGQLQAMSEEFEGLVSNPRGLGLMCAFDLPDGGNRRVFLDKLFEHHVLMLGCGDRSVRFRTALNIPREDLDKGLDIIRKVLRELS